MIDKTGRLLLAFIFLFFFAGCGDEEDGDLPGNGYDMPDPGEFEAGVTGDIERDLQGTALFDMMVDQDTGDTFFILNLSTNETPTNNMWFSKGWARPSTGSYQVQDLDPDDLDDSWAPGEDRFAFLFIDDPDGNMALVLSDGGEVEISRSREDEVAGEFIIQATGFYLTDLNTVLEVEVRGAFNAIVGEVQLPEL
ncbi:MAG: hypothetical protein ACLFN2_07985 [Bacteroidales bacterium]